MAKKKSQGIGSRVRQEVLNVYLAELLQERGLVALPEQILSRRGQSHHMPDVIVDFQGLRLAIEGEFASTRAKKRASESALNRVEEGIAHIGIAVVYPVSLRSAHTRKELSDAELEFAVITETHSADAQQLPLIQVREENHFSFVKGSINDLVEALRQSYEQLIKDEVLQHAVSLIGGAIEHFVNALATQPATPERFAEALDVKELSSVTSVEEE
jgi:hypothetical protein